MIVQRAPAEHLGRVSYCPQGIDGSGGQISGNNSFDTATHDHGIRKQALRILNSNPNPPNPAAASNAEGLGDTHLRRMPRLVSTRSWSELSLVMAEDALIVRGAREHNLRNVDVTIPRDRLTVITGLSGSGKSSLAFDTIYAEGQRRYVESLSAYARQFLGLMEKPDVDAIEGL